MTNLVERRLYIATNGIRQGIGPDDSALRKEYELLVREHYERCHPEDTFDDLMRRARFSKEDQGLLQDWMAVARRLRQGDRDSLRTTTMDSEPDPRRENPQGTSQAEYGLQRAQREAAMAE